MMAIKLPGDVGQFRVGRETVYGLDVGWVEEIASNHPHLNVEALVEETTGDTLIQWEPKRDTPHI